MTEQLPRTLDAIEALEQALAENHGSIPRAARALQCKPQQIHQWAASDPEVYNRIRAAQLIGYSSLEEAALTRAVDGVEVPIYAKGELVGYKTEYSDGLLSQMLKARVEGYAPTESHTALQVNVAIMPRASTYEEWVAQRDIQLNGTATPALSPPVQIEDANYTELPDDKQPDHVRLRDVL